MLDTRLVARNFRPGDVVTELRAFVGYKLSYKLRVKEMSDGWIPKGAPKPAARG